MNCQITTLIITKNHEQYITPTLESIKDIGQIMIADIGSTDNTIDTCKKYGAKVFTIPFNYNYASIKNTLSSKVNTEWVLWLEPGEEIVSGKDYLSLDKSDPMYRLMVVNDDLLMKQTRLIRKEHSRYINPVFESLKSDLSEQTLPVVISGTTKIDEEATMNCLLRWKDEEPLSPEPDYYTAFFHLMCGRNEQFLNAAEHYLFLKKAIDESTVLTRYYMALLKKKNVGKSLQLILECIAAYPLMAEFWCLLGDLYLFKIKEYDRAYLFYENAIILGSQRLAEDTMPMEISKYEEYPQKMMEAIKKAIALSVS